MHWLHRLVNPLTCWNCGARVGPHGEFCSWCGARVRK
jgi:ribosomal protein L40E